MQVRKLEAYVNQTLYTPDGGNRSLFVQVGSMCTRWRGPTMAPACLLAIPGTSDRGGGPAGRVAERTLSPFLNPPPALRTTTRLAYARRCCTTAATPSTPRCAAPPSCTPSQHSPRFTACSRALALALAALAWNTTHEM